MMKYQKLKNVENIWKWQYLVKKHREGVVISRYSEDHKTKQVVDKLFELEQQPTEVALWIEKHINPQITKRLQQTIRARRKRYFNSKNPYTKKKSIDLEFLTWQRLTLHAKKLHLTLSGTIDCLLDEAEKKSQHSLSLREIKNNLMDLLHLQQANHCSDTV